jgi:hypothetical protein
MTGGFSVSSASDFPLSDQSDFPHHVTVENAAGERFPVSILLIDKIAKPAIKHPEN